MSDPRADDDTQPIAPPRPLAPAGASATTAEPQARTAAERPSPEPGPSRTADLAPSDHLSAPPTAGTSTAQPAQPVQVTQPERPKAQYNEPAAPRTPPPARPSGRKARLRLVRLDPWSVMKMALALSIALAIVLVVAVVIVWLVLSAAGVWDAINDSISAVLDGDTNGFDVEDYVSLERVAGIALVLAALNVVLMTTLATLGAFLYNLAASLLGGLEVTLAEDR
jgi:hypothetical protein